jgi:hypothetical protein
LSGTGSAGERPIDKTVWLTLPFSARSLNAQISKVHEMEPLFGQERHRLT